jgi:hypothetical protein
VSKRSDKDSYSYPINAVLCSFLAGNLSNSGYSTYKTLAAGISCILLTSIFSPAAAETSRENSNYNAPHSLLPSDLTINEKSLNVAGDVGEGLE